mmetsp:Transcript_129780/g.211313  ORF Transcript_129780/g.211313 Transcript_129780/m.211313 type:complete len:126 (-) Transcript_129780:141-518(-)
MVLAMKKTTAMKAMKVMKKKQASKIAKGKMAKVMVLRGSKEKTRGGLTKDSVMRNKRGKVVSKKASAHGRRVYRNIEDWTEALMEAREALHARGFVAVNGKTLQGKALYVKAKAIRAARRQGQSS